MDISAQFARIFSGFCGQQFAPSFENPPHSCTADSDCTTRTFTKCRQRTFGAFGQGTARTITETGTTAVCLSDGAAHPLTLVGLLDIPPTYNALVDGAYDLPGPGAISQQATIQLLP